MFTWLTRLLRRRYEAQDSPEPRLGISGAPLDAELLAASGKLLPSEAAADRLAQRERLHIGGENVLEQAVEAAIHGPYPTPDCLTPAEIEAYANQAISSYLAEHVPACPGCRALVSSVRPADQHLRAFQAALARRREYSPVPVMRIVGQVDEAIATTSEESAVAMTSG